MNINVEERNDTDRKEGSCAPSAQDLASDLLSPRPLPPPWTIALAFGLIYTSWGTTYLAIKLGVRDEHLPPALFGGVRVSAAGLVLLAFAAWRGHSLRLEGRDFRFIVLTGFLLFVCGNGLITWAEETVDSGVAAVLAATTPLWIGLLACLWPTGERLGPRGWAGLMLGLAGVLILLGPNLHDPTAFIEDLGPFLVLGSAASWGLGSLVVRHYRPAADHVTVAAYQMVVGGGALALLGVILGEPAHLPSEITAGAMGAFFYLLVVGSLIGFVSFNFLLQHVRASQVSTYAYVNPVVAVLIGWAVGEPMTPWLACGIATILTGVALVRGGARSAPSHQDR
jgi:drug/metabolite transporter (DMT)-like permease